MPTRHPFVTVVSATVLSLSAAAVTAGSAAGMSVPEPGPHPHLTDPAHGRVTAGLLEMSALKLEYAATRLPSVHNAIVLILHSPASSVL